MPPFDKEKHQKPTQIQQDLLTQKKIWEKSRQAALYCLKAFPGAKILFRGKSKKEQRKWIPLSKTQIKKNKEEGFYAVILDSLPFKACFLDFDPKSKAHKSGGSVKNLNRIWFDWGLMGYAWVQTTHHEGRHALFRDAPSDEKSGDNKMGKGIDYKTGNDLMMLYDPELWKRRPKDLRSLPQAAILAMEKINRANQKDKKAGVKPKPGPGQTNAFLNSGFGTYIKTPAGQIVKKIYEILKEYTANPGKPGLEEALQKVTKSLQNDLNQRKNTRPQTPPKIQDPTLSHDLSKITPHPTETRLKRTLVMVNEAKDGISSNKLKEKICKEFKVSWKTAGNTLKTLKENKPPLIEGGGQGQNSKDLKITKAGKASLQD